MRQRHPRPGEDRTWRPPATLRERRDRKPLSPPPPADDAPEPRRRSAAEEARTILAGTAIGSLASLTEAGAPWASIVTYAALADGSPAFSLSTLALHGRNLKGDRRTSLAVAETPAVPGDPAEVGRITVAGIVEEPTGVRLDEARSAYGAAVPSAELFTGLGDFTWWVLRVEEIRWVGGFGRMDRVEPADFAAAEPDPVAPAAAGAVAHLNADHADALLLIARTLGGHPDARSATCTGADRYGLDLALVTPRGSTDARVGFAEPVAEPDGLRAATVTLVGRARDLSP